VRAVLHAVYKLRHGYGGERDVISLVRADAVKSRPGRLYSFGSLTAWLLPFLNSFAFSITKPPDIYTSMMET
jgi:hypothetical protein